MINYKIKTLKKNLLTKNQKIKKVIQLFNLFKDAKEGIERKTRVYRLRSHKDCFQGSDAVDWFIGKIKLNSRDEGVAIGELLMKLGLISHVLGCEPFQDNKMFYYRFKSVCFFFFFNYFNLFFNLFCYFNLNYLFLFI